MISRESSPGSAGLCVATPGGVSPARPWQQRWRAASTIRLPPPRRGQRGARSPAPVPPPRAAPAPRPGGEGGANRPNRSRAAGTGW